MCPVKQYCDVITNQRWRTAAILKIAKSPYLSEKSSDFDKTWYTTANIEPNDSHVTRNWNFWNSRWRRSPSWKSLFWPLLINWLSDFSKILYEEERHADKGYGTKMQMYKIQDGIRPPFWKSVNRHISVKNCPILMKFGTLHQILNPVTVTWPKIEIFGIQDGSNRHLKNHFFGHNSLTDCLISAKFCLRKQNSMPTEATTKNANF